MCTSCASGYYTNTVTNTCVPCTDSQCYSCYSSASYCDNCYSGYVAVGGTCVACPSLQTTIAANHQTQQILYYFIYYILYNI